MKTKGLTIVCLGLLISVLMVSGISFALTQRAQTPGAELPGVQKDLADTIRAEDSSEPGGETPGDTRPSGAKKSAYSAIATLIQNGLSTEGAEFTRVGLRYLRQNYGRTITGDPNWSIGETMLSTEINDMLMLGLIERTSAGNYRVAVTMNQEQLDEIDRQFQQIPSLTRRDQDREAAIGLNSYDLNTVLGDEEKTAARQIAGQVLLTGQTIRVAASDNPLNGVQYESVVAITERHLIGENALTPEALSARTRDVREGGQRLAIATSRRIEPDSATGRLNREDEAYVTRVLRALPMEYDSAVELLRKQVIVFSHIPDAEMLAQIENMGIGYTLNNLAPAVARAVVRGV